MPHENFDDIIAKHPRQSYFDDILWTYNRGKVNQTRKKLELLNLITNSPNVVKAMREYTNQISQLKKYDGYTEKQLIDVTESRVKEYATEM